jgi:hypothetical protein
MVNRISIKIRFGRYGQVTMREQNTYHKFHKPRETIDQTLCVTFRYTSSSLSLIHLSWPMYVTRLDGTYGSVAKGSNVIR